MAHPLRLRLYYALAVAGSATATGLAERVGESVSLVSYHLRQLAKHGYVEPDPDHEAGAGGDGRERWWRTTTGGFSWYASDFAARPEEAQAAATVERQMDAHRAAYRQAWLDSRHAWSAAWRDAAISSDYPLLRMTPDELEEFGRQYTALLQTWRDHLADAPDDPDREQVMLLLQAFPFRP
jgi:DNA-binding transcriptional ArsR family regulator